MNNTADCRIIGTRYVIIPGEIPIPWKGVDLAGCLTALERIVDCYGGRSPYYDAPYYCALVALRTLRQSIPLMDIMASPEYTVTLGKEIKG